MSKRVSYDTVMVDTILVDPHAVFNFPHDFASQIKAHEQRTNKSAANASAGTSTTSNNQAFYDIDDLSLIPFDRVDF